MAEILNNLSHVYFLQGEYDKAEPLLKRARKEKSDESKTLYLKNLTVLYLAKGRQYMQQGRHAEAEPILQQVIAFYMDPSHQLDRPSVPDLASMLDEYSSELGKLNRVAAADEWHARAEAMRKNNPPQN
jgi:tetratricopeptide (TPR) repeat protein